MGQSIIVAPLNVSSHAYLDVCAFSNVIPRTRVSLAVPDDCVEKHQCPGVGEAQKSNGPSGPRARRVRYQPAPVTATPTTAYCETET